METKPRTYASHPNTGNKKVVVHPVDIVKNIWGERYVDMFDPQTKKFLGRAIGNMVVGTIHHRCQKICFSAKFYNGPINIWLFQQ